MFDMNRAKWLCTRGPLRTPPAASDYRAASDYLPVAVAEIERLRVALSAIKALAVSDRFDPGHPEIYKLADDALAANVTKEGGVAGEEGGVMAENFDRFIEAVKAGKIEGLSVSTQGDRPWRLELGPLTPVLINHKTGWRVVDDCRTDHLCAHLRRWMSGRNYVVELDTDRYLFVARDGYYIDSSEGSELDWHIDAALWVLEQEGEDK